MSAASLTTNRNANITITGAAMVLIRAACCAISRTLSWGSCNSDNPNHTGVPMAPKVTGMVFSTKQNSATRKAGKPRL